MRLAMPHPMPNVGLSIKLSPAEQTQLWQWECAHGTPQQVALPRFICHFVPASSSWLNLVEHWFRELTDTALRRGSFVSVPDLTRAIDEFLKACNENPKPFIWKATVEDIVQEIAGLEPSSSRSSLATNRAHIYATPSCR